MSFKSTESLNENAVTKCSKDLLPDTRHEAKKFIAGNNINELMEVWLLQHYTGIGLLECLIMLLFVFERINQGGIFESVHVCYIIY